jgi:endonuclease YncB( thermonuclease family)
MMNLLRLVLLAIALPGRLAIRSLNRLQDSTGQPHLGLAHRVVLHGFVWLAGLIVIGAVVAPDPPAPAPAEGMVLGPAGYVSTEQIRAATEDYLAEHPSGVDRMIPTGSPVARVIDGDTFELADGRVVRVLGIDSCEMETPGGGQAKLAAQDVLLNTHVVLTAEPGVDTDRYGRLLRYVTTAGNGDLGEHLVRFDHTGVYQGRNDASEAYLARLYARDLEYAARPPSGRECGATITEDDGTAYVPVPDNDREGRFCGRRWWC